MWLRKTDTQLKRRIQTVTITITKCSDCNNIVYNKTKWYELQQGSKLAMPRMAKASKISLRATEIMKFFSLIYHLLALGQAVSKVNFEPCCIILVPYYGWWHYGLRTCLTQKVLDVTGFESRWLCYIGASGHAFTVSMLGDGLKRYNILFAWGLCKPCAR